MIHPKSHPNLGILLVHLVLHRNNKERALYLYWRFPKDGWKLHLSMPRLLQWRIVFLAVPRLTSWIIASKKSSHVTYTSLRSTTCSLFSDCSCDLCRENEYLRNLENRAEKLDFRRKALECLLKECRLTPPATSASSAGTSKRSTFTTSSSSGLGLLLSLRRRLLSSSGTEDKFEAKLAVGFTLFFLIMASEAAAVGEEPFSEDTKSWKEGGYQKWIG